MVRKKSLELGGPDQSRKDKNLLYGHDEPKKPTQEGPLHCKKR
jgi:hypothetical protein